MTLPWRILELVLRLGDWVFFPNLLMALNRLFKPNTRRLTPAEIALAQEIFGNSIDYSKVWVDDCSHIGCRRYHFAYVGFNIINSWGPLAPQIFIHEMVHVWQFQTGGSAYIPRALWAQRTPMGYDYGGVSALQNAIDNGKRLKDFNYEQQGDIVADYFCLLKDLRPRWCAANPDYRPLFVALIGDSFKRNFKI